MEKIPQTKAERVDWLLANIRQDNSKEHTYFYDEELGMKKLDYIGSRDRL